MYRGANKSLARPTSQCILFDGENISFVTSLVAWWSELLTTNHEVPSSIPGSNMYVFPWKGKTPMVTMVWVAGRN